MRSWGPYRRPQDHKTGRIDAVELHPGSVSGTLTMEVDRTELNNLAGKNQPLEKDLLNQYDGWATANGVMDWNVALPRLLDAWKIGSAEG